MSRSALWGWNCQLKLQSELVRMGVAAHSYIVDYRVISGSLQVCLTTIVLFHDFSLQLSTIDIVTVNGYCGVGPVSNCEVVGPRK